MARFGEGDPRWLVEERVDGTNVNNWHWSDFNVTSLAKERLTASFKNLVLTKKDDAEFHCELTKLENCSGDVTVSCRKGKLYIFYELDIKLNWKGNKVGGQPCTGTIHMPEVETDDDDYEVKVSSSAQTSDDIKLVQIIKKDGVPLIKEKISAFLKQLRTENEDKLLKGKKQDPKPSTTPNTTPNVSSSSIPIPTSSSSSAAASSSKNASAVDKNGLETVTIKMKTKFDAPPHEVFNAHFDAPRISACTGSPCDIKPVEGSSFIMYGGQVQGKVVKIESTKKLVQQWRFKNWPEGHFSTVTMEFNSENYGTILNMTQVGVLAEDSERVQSGWNDNFWRRLKAMCNWGS